MDNKKEIPFSNAAKKCFENGGKKCPVCGEFKTPDNFYVLTNRLKGAKNLHSWCKPCLIEDKRQKRKDPLFRTWNRVEGDMTEQEKRKVYTQRTKDKKRARLVKHINTAPCDCCGRITSGHKVYHMNVSKQVAKVFCSWACALNTKKKVKLRDLEEGEVLT